MTCLAAGLLDDNSKVDLVFLKGGTLWAAFDYADQLQYVQLRSGVSDFCFLPGDGGASGTLVYASGPDLYSGQWDWTNGFTPEHSLVVPGWASIEEVQPVHWSATGPGVLVLANNRHVIAGASAGGSGWTLDYEYLLPGEIGAAAAFEWDGDADDEVAFVTDGRLWVYDTTGAFEADLAPATLEDRLIVLPGYQGTTDGIAWVTRALSNQDTWMVVFDFQGHEPVQVLGDVDFDDVVLADVVPDSAGNLDLVLGLQGSPSLLLMDGGDGDPVGLNTFEMPSFAPPAFDLTGDSTETEPGGGGPPDLGGEKRLTTVDLDLDGDLDLVVSHDGRLELLDLRLGAADDLDAVFVVSSDVALMPDPLGPPVNQITLGLTLTVFEGGYEPTPEYAKLQVFGQADVGSGVDPTPLGEWTVLYTDPLVLDQVVDLGAFNSEDAFQLRLTPIDTSPSNPTTYPSTIVHFAVHPEPWGDLKELPEIAGYFLSDEEPETPGGSTTRPRLLPVTGSTTTGP